MIRLRDFVPNFPYYDDYSFQQKIYNKEEFYRYRLAREQEQVAPFQYLNQQQIVKLYMSEHTANDGILLWHEMGTGKTCAAFAVSEGLKYSELYKHCFVFASGKDLLTNLMRSLVSTCSRDYPLDKTENPATEMRQIHKLLKQYYTFNTFITSARRLEALSDEQIVKIYSNSILIIDEVHNIRDIPKGEKVNVYAQFHRLFHLPRNCKKILLSGTPIKDEISEIADVMNLILPLDEQLPVGNEFVNYFFRRLDDGSFEPWPDRAMILKAHFSGRVSYLRAPSADIITKYQGIPLKKGMDVPQFRIVPLEMSKVQRNAYRAAYAKDTSGDVNSIYSNCRQASLFVFPDGTWGPAGISTFMDARGRMRPALVEQVGSLARLTQLSVKYAATIKLVLENPNKNIFVYNSIVNGSGAKLFAQILEQYGYTRCTGTEFSSKAKRYILLTGETQNIGRLLKFYNREANANGEYCQIIIGSKKIGEGYTFKSVQIEVFHTYHWNYTETDQAAKRARRYGAYQYLAPNTVLNVYQYVSLMDHKDRRDSIDCLMLEFSLQKDLSIKRIERIAQTSSFDCPLTYERNVGTIAGSRECNYQACEYQCDTSALARTDADYSTYELYYSNFMDLVPRIRALFSERNMLTYAAIQSLVVAEEEIQLIKALAYVVENNVLIRNKYNYPCYLREAANRYFLVPDPYSPYVDSSRLLAGVYGSTLQHPVFGHSETLDDVTRRLERDRALVLLREFVADPPRGEDGFLRRLDTYPERLRDLFIEHAIVLFLRGVKTRFVVYVMNVFIDRIIFPEAGGSNLAVFASFEGPQKCLGRDMQWSICSVEVARRTERVEVEKKGEVLNYPIPEGAKYIGIYQRDPLTQKEKFCIQDLERNKNIKDKRRKTSGAVCEEAGWKKAKLVQLMKELKIAPEDGSGDYETYWGGRGKTKKDICAAIRGSLEERGLLFPGTCGTSNKFKPAAE